MLSSVSVRRETQENDDETTVNNLRVVINEQMSSQDGGAILIPESQLSSFSQKTEQTDSKKGLIRLVSQH